MGANAFCPKTRLGRAGLTVTAAAAIAFLEMTAPAAARGPEGIADVAEQVIDAVVNVSTKQSVDLRGGAMPQLPPGSPFEEFFEEFFKNRRGQNGQSGPGQNNQTPTPRRVNSLGSGFIIDPSGRCRDQQPRHFRSRRGQRHSQRWHDIEGRSDWPRSEDRSRADQGYADQAVEGGEIRRQRQAASGRVGDRDRKSVQSGRNGDGRHRLGAQPRHSVRPLRQLHPDRCLD